MCELSFSDHEYEPIGEPPSDEMDIDQDTSEAHKRKSSDDQEGNEKKLLRTPTEDSEDNISAQDFQDQIESRFFFRREIEPIADHEPQPHQEKIVDEAVIIDETPVVREIPKKKSFMESASNKIKAQASSLKSSINNKMKKKPKEKPVAVEVADEPQVDDEEIVDEEKETVESITINVQEAEEEAAKSKTSKMSKFAKNIKKPSMPKFKKPQFKKPEMPKISLPDRPKMPDLKMSEKFSNFRKLGRSKSMKEEVPTAGDSTSLNTPEVMSAEPVKKKFDFGTYPRMIRDKFKRPKLPERSDRSMVSESPAPDDEFNQAPQVFAQRGPVASRWPEYAEEESGKYQHFDSESDLDRERIELEPDRHLMTDEQRQLDDMDRENLQIHLMAKQEKFRKPFVERQPSDVGSDDDKLMWSGVLNKNVKEEDFEPNALRFDDDYKFTLDAYNNQEINRSMTPQTNQETQSSGSSGTRRRKGFLDDDDDYFMRDQPTITQQRHSPSDYIDSAMKEGLSSPDSNALAHMDDFEDDRPLTPEKPIRSLKRKKKTKDDELDVERERSAGNDYFKTYPPNRPQRKEKKSLSEEPDDEIHYHHDMPDDSSEIIDEQDLGTFKGIEHPDLAYMRDDYDNDIDYNISNLPVPPTPPRRRKKKMRGVHAYSTLRNEHLMQKSIPLKNEKVSGEK